MHVLRFVLGGLLAVELAVPVGIFHYVSVQDVQYGRFVDFSDTDGLASTAFALYAVRRCYSLYERSGACLSRTRGVRGTGPL